MRLLRRFLHWLRPKRELLPGSRVAAMRELLKKRGA